MLAVPETILRAGADMRRLPDVVVGTIQGLRLMIEGKVDDSPGARNLVERDARKRVEEGLVRLCLAVLYPPELRTTTPDKLTETFFRARLGMRVFSESGEGDWLEGDLETLSAGIRRAYDNLVREDVVAQAVQEIEGALHVVSEALLSTGTSVARLRETLGILENGDDSEAQGDGDEGT